MKNIALALLLVLTLVLPSSAQDYVWGITGIIISVPDSKRPIKVIGIVPGSPAATPVDKKPIFNTGDVILELDHESVVEKPFEEVMQIAHGKDKLYQEGSLMHVKYLHKETPESEPKEQETYLLRVNVYRLQPQLNELIRLSGGNSVILLLVI